MTDKEKQIEEMAKITCYVCEFGRMFNGECDLGHDDPCSIALEAAEKLYDSGYRKQVEGEWLERTEYNELEDCEDYFYQCSVCGLCTPCAPNFCMDCGAKMIGGEYGS